MSADKTRAEVWADMIEVQAPGAAKELRRLSASEAALIEALTLWLDINDKPAGFVGKYGRELDAAIAAQQRKVDAAAEAARAALKAAKEARQ